MKFYQKIFSLLATLITLQTLLVLVNTDAINDKYFYRLSVDSSLIPKDQPQNYFGPVVLDTFTECAGLAIGIGNNLSKGGVIEKTLRSSVIFSCEKLKSNLNTIDPESIEDYGRFWHGYQIFTKPLIILGGIDLLRKFNFLITIIIFYLYIYIGMKKIGLMAVIPLMPFVVTFNPDILFLFTHSIFYNLSLVFSIYLLRTDFRSPNLSYICFIYGCVAAFLSFLVYPVLYFSIPCAVYCIFAIKNVILIKDYYITTFRLIFFSLTGFILFWAYKFYLIYISGYTFNTNAIKQANDWSNFNITFYEVLSRTLFIKFDIYFFIICVIVTGIIFKFKIKLNYLYYAVPALILTLLWLSIFRGHTIHGFSSVSVYGIIFSSLLLFSIPLSKILLLINRNLLKVEK